ncbi:hemolysin family protein [Exiguobacterium flavidum]|uniref:hemolysin family protein n=1 Tax=Exiguobacterium flavidum TaxID=2184695 RepID=UPI000DF75E5F|nr:hemolysin family protein [Exiguobacterium flavidum]
MDPVPAMQLIWFLILLFVSAFFSSSETALSSANRLRILHQAEGGSGRAKQAFRQIQRYEETMTTILIGNTLANLSVALIGGWLALAYDSFWMKALVLALAFLLIFVFGELVPKSYAREHAETYALAVSRPLQLAIVLFKPLVWIFLKLRSLALVMIGADPKGPLVTEQELKALVDISEEEGVMGESEAELVHSAVDFKNTIVEEALTPRMDIQAIDIDDTFEEILAEVQKGGFSRLPVYKDSIDHVIGVLSERDFLRELVKNGEVDIRELIRPVSFVVPQTRLIDLLPELRIKQSHMAIVLDEFGGTAGLITLEDILEEIVGEIWDEHDESLDYTKQIGPNRYECLAEYDIEDFCEQFELTMPDTDAQTLGGWIIEGIGRIPEVGARMTYEHVTFTVLHVENRRVRRVLAIFQEKQEQEKMEIR